MRVYFAEMFPIPQHAGLALLAYLAIAYFGRWLQQQSSSIASCYTLLGIWSIFNLLLILRLMDELKDEDIDRALFPERPLPSGRVFATDIKITLAGAILIYLAAHLAADLAFWTALLLLGYSGLMFKRFFAPDLLRNNLIITLVTHNPIVPGMLAQGFVIFAVEHGLAIGALRWSLVVPFIVMLWLPLLAWEWARKIRAPDEETAYMTYSRLFGYAGATLTTAGFQTIALCIGLYFWWRFSLSWLYPVIIASGFGLNVWAQWRFLLHPKPCMAHLKDYALAYLLSTELAQLVEFAGLVAARGD
jgi:4-hydroxybenzoate polyprenyltransferase